MKTISKVSVKTFTAKAVSAIAGDSHLVAQSIADTIVKVEQSLVNRLTGQDKHEIGKQRNKATAEQQEAIKIGAVGIGAWCSNIVKRKLNKVEPDMSFEEHQIIVNNA
tara:strand:- start:1400 stop:1723 length:324 start_codon:yes stop_codon:yes gene_type:complete